MEKLNLKFLKIGLQFFADENNQENNEGNSQNEDQNSNNAGEKNKAEESKTYTNEEIQKMMSKEKKQGKSAGKSELMKELGIENLDEFKEAMKEFNKYQEEKKTESQKANEKVTKADNERDLANKRAEIAEAKVEAMKNGVNPDYVDDVITLALAKKKDGEDLADIIEDMKETHAIFFKSKEENGGTGNNIGNKKAPVKTDGIGATLGKNKAKVAKSSYFNN